MAGEHLADAAVRLMNLWKNEEDVALIPIMGHFLQKEQGIDADQSVEEGIDDTQKAKEPQNQKMEEGEKKIVVDGGEQTKDGQKAPEGEVLEKTEKQEVLTNTETDKAGQKLEAEQGAEKEDKQIAD